MLQRSRKSLVSAAFLTLSLLALLVWIIAPTVPTNPSQHSFQYFSEIELHPSTRRLGKNVHQDTRHASHRVPDADYLHLVQQNLLETYFSQIGSWNIETWIAHGTLLGWYWNQKLLPWDTDVDVQMSMESLRSIADRFNGSTHTFSYGGRRRSYTLDVNPAYTTASILDTANRIDARWIDVQEGNFIDITAVRYVSAERLFCKDGHYYTTQDLFPLRRTYIENFTINVPFEYDKILSREYGKRALKNSHFHWHSFNKYTKQWEPDRGINGRVV